MYTFRYKRLANGSIVLKENDASANERVTIAAIRARAAANRSALARFFLSKTNRRAAKSVYQHLLMNLVPATPFGSAAKLARAKRLHSKMIKNYVLRSLVLPGAQLLGTMIVEALKKHYGTYIKRQVMLKRLATMSLEEVCAELGVPVPVYDKDAYEAAHRPNYTLAYEPTGVVSHALRSYVDAFVPYANYSRIYYSPDEDLPAPVLPVATYPWRWRTQLAETRDAVLQIMALTADARAHEIEQLMHDDAVDDDDNSGSDTATHDGSRPEAPGAHAGTASGSTTLFSQHWHLQSNSSLAAVASSSSSASAGADSDADADSDAETAFQAAEEFEDLVREYHFATGIPRLAQQNHSYAPFPTLASLLSERPTRANSSSSNTSSSSSSSSSAGVSAFASAGPNASPSNINSSGNASNAMLSESSEPLTGATGDSLRQQRKRVLHDAMVQFYAYPSVDSAMVRLPAAAGDTETRSAGANCSAAVPCLVQSGVTVFTPQLCDLRFFHTVVMNASVTPEQQRQRRVQALQRMVAVAFEAERRALAAGVQAPSTAWYALFDRSIDEFADAVQGCVAAAWRNGAGDSARDVYERLVRDPQRSPLHTSTSYYWSTLRDTKRAMEVTKRVPLLAALAERELSELLQSLTREMQQLDAALTAFIAARAADAEYQSVMHATATRAEYTGSEFSTLGFGFQLPATNTRNVLVRDMRQPEPLHVALRLLVRLQESRLVLPPESHHVLACLAMLRRGITYYRCR